ncbi:VenA family class IV lanthipeptide [Streptomyces sp. NPDC001193]
MENHDLELLAHLHALPETDPVGVDGDQFSAEGATLSEVIASLEANHPGISARVLDDQGKLRRFVNVYVNDDDVRFEGGLDAVTPDGAGVSIIPAVAGGC